MQRCRFHRRAAKVCAMAAAAVVAAVSPAARAADSWAISIGVRETGSSGAIGSNGGTSGAIEWIDLDNFTINADDTWHTVTWNFAPGMHTATSFSGGNGVLSAANNKGVLEHIRIRNAGGNAGGEIRLRIDDIVNTVGGVPTTVTGFEGFSTATANDTLMFREPIFSASTINNMSTGANGTLISTASANSGAQSLAARWTFVPDGDPDQWLRLTTNNASTLGNPVIDIGPTSSLSIAFRMSVYNPTGTRVRGIDASQFQGSGHDWVRAAAPMSAGGGGLSFAFLRATRGGTSGISSTGSNRVDDPQYAANIAGAKAAGLLTGPYHFGRPDLWTPNDSVGLGNAPDTVGTPEDEARHYLEVAGNVMKPGYMRPVYDLEDGNEETNNTQLTNFVLRFNDTLKKYKGPAAQIIVYSGTTYANSVNEPLSQFPLWMPRFQVESDWAAGDVFPSESSYGVWGDSNPGTNLQPWNFWQYYSPDVYIPGINAGTHNDIDVAHGDINYVRQFMVQGAIWDGSSNNQWTTNANWDTNVAQTGSTEVLFDTTIPPTGSTITLTSGRSAGGVYFANNYTLSGGSLTLTDGRIDVDPTRTATISTNLATPNGFRKVGRGTLVHSGGTSSVTGIAQVLQGTMSVSGGSIAVSGNLMVNPELTQFDKSLIAPLPGSASEITSGTLNINGGAVTAPAAYVGGTDTASGAIGTLNVSSGSLTVGGVLKIWNSGVPMVDSKVNLSGGTLSVGSIDTNDDTASFNWTAGTFAVTGAGGLAVNGNGPIGPTVTLGTGKALVVTNTLTFGSLTQLTLQNGGALTAGNINTVGDPADLIWTGGTLTLNGPGTSVLGARTLGGASPQTFNVSGGTVVTEDLVVGNTGSATANQTGGLLSVGMVGGTARNLSIAAQPGSTGTYNLGGAGGLGVTGTLYVGGNSSAAGGTGVLNINTFAAQLSAPVLKIWDSGAAAPNGTRVNFSAGTVSVGHIDTGGNPARFNFTGGTLNHNGPGTSDLSGTTISPVAILNINGGTVAGTSLSIDAGGSVHVNPAGTLAAETENDGFLSLNGGTVTHSVLNNAAGILQVTSSDPSVFGPAATVDNLGTINVNSPANVAFNAGVAGPGTINVAAGASMSTVVVASGTLNVNGALTVAPGWPVANVAGVLSVGAGGRIDLNDNKLVVLSGTLGSFNGTAYTGVTGLIATGYNGGAWDGNGIVTSMSDGASGLTSLAVADAEQAGYVGGTFGGVPVEAGNILVMYTYAGDANLDGFISGDDYSTIDFNIAVPNASGWYNGDFNYDGIISGDDYSVIDFNIVAQGAPFPTSGIGGLQVTPVPEPAGACAAGVAAAVLLLARRSRHRRPGNREYIS